MSWVGEAIGLPSAGFRMLFADSIKTRDSSCDSYDSGRCTAIWSPSKSALKAWQTSGWILIALPSIRIGSNAWMPRRGGVGGRLRGHGGALLTLPGVAHTAGAS